MKITKLIVPLFFFVAFYSATSYTSRMADDAHDMLKSALQTEAQRDAQIEAIRALKLQIAEIQTSFDVMAQMLPQVGDITPKDMGLETKESGGLIHSKGKGSLNAFDTKVRLILSFGGLQRVSVSFVTEALFDFDLDVWMRVKRGAAQ